MKSFEIGVSGEGSRGIVWTEAGNDLYSGMERVNVGIGEVRSSEGSIRIMRETVRAVRKPCVRASAIMNCLS